MGVVAHVEAYHLSTQLYLKPSYFRTEIKRGSMAKVFTGIVMNAATSTFVAHERLTASRNNHQVQGLRSWKRMEQTLIPLLLLLLLLAEKTQQHEAKKKLVWDYASIFTPYSPSVDTTTDKRICSVERMPAAA